jgi:uncharacterized damage-inducible protein DinB
MKDSILLEFNRYSAEVHQLIEEAGRYDEEVLNTKNGPGWSAAQVMWHLILVEENSLKKLKKKLSYQPTLHKAGINTEVRSFLLKLFLKLPLKWKAPRITGDEHIPGRSNLAEITRRWLASLEDWNSFLRQLPEDLADKSIYNHPRAGRITQKQTLAFFRQHLERHAGQMRRAIEAAVRQ